LKNYFLLLIAVFNIVQYSNGQIRINSNSLIPKEYKINPEKVVGQNNSSFFFLNSSTIGKGISFTIDKYDINSRQKLFSKSIAVENESKLPVLDAFLCNNNLLIFRRFYDPDSPNYTIVLQIMDTAGVVQENLKEIVTNTVLPSESLANSSLANSMEYYFFTSDDKKKILIVSEEHQTEYIYEDNIVKLNNSIKKVNLTIFDTEKLIIRSTRELPLNYERSKLIPEKYQIDDNENIFFLYSYFNNENKIKKAVGVMHSTGSSIIGSDIQIDLFKNKIKDLDFVIHKGKIHCSGIYQKQTIDSKQKNSDYNRYGIFYQTIDIKTFKTENIDSTKFTSEVISKLQDTDTNYIMTNCKIGALKIINDELYTICQFHNLHHIFASFEIRSLLSSGSFIVSKYNLKKIDWMRAIPSKLSYVACTKFAYLILPDEHHFRLLYLEHPCIGEKFNTSTAYTMSDCKVVKYTGSNLVSMKISSSGDLTKEIIHRNKKMLVLFSPLNSHVYKIFYSQIKGSARIPSRADLFIPQSYNFIIPLSTHESLLYFINENKKSHAFIKYTID
jgi:hypothetical protein